MSVAVAVARPVSLIQPSPARVGLAILVLVASAAGFVVTPHQATAGAIAQMGADWGNLLRAMAVLKSAMAAGAAAAVYWRLGSEVSPWRLAAYGASAAAMAAGPGLIWGLWHIGLGALLLHAGLAATVLLLWRDPCVSARLARMVAGHRAPYPR
jgi:hypothetical protein